LDGGRIASNEVMKVDAPEVEFDPARGAIGSSRGSLAHHLTWTEKLFFARTPSKVTETLPANRLPRACLRPEDAEFHMGRF
jgi:hypothetical protein